MSLKLVIKTKILQIFAEAEINLREITNLELIL
jgi:hypothetical protein